MNHIQTLKRLEVALNYYKIRLIRSNFVTELNYSSSIYRRMLLDSWKLDHPEAAKQITDPELYNVFSHVLKLHFDPSEPILPNIAPYTAVFAP